MESGMGWSREMMKRMEKSRKMRRRRWRGANHILNHAIGLSLP